MRRFAVKINQINELSLFAQARVQRAENRDFLRVGASFRAFSAAFSTDSV
jgi:hypothetical protein